MNLSRQDIDGIIRNFRDHPTADNYHIVNNWYGNNMYTGDSEYITCVYLFLQGANIKQHYYPITIDQHRELVSQIRDLIEKADPLVRPQRKAYLDFGSKAGYYK